MAREWSLGNVLEVRPATAEDLAGPFAYRYDPVKVIRDRHHAIARMLAYGMKQTEIARELGCTPQSIRVLVQDPAIIELTAEYRAEVDAEAQPIIDETARLFNLGRLKFTKMLIDEVEEHEANGTRPPLQRVLQAVEFFSDRTGYAKRTEVVHRDGDFAAKLMLAQARSAAVQASRTLELRPVPSDPPSLAQSPQVEAREQVAAAPAPFFSSPLRPGLPADGVDGRGRALPAAVPSLRRRAFA